MIVRITEIDDVRLDPFRRTRDRDLRADEGRFVVESPRVVSRFLDAAREGRFSIDRLLVAPEHAATFVSIAEPLDAVVHVAEEELMTAASGYHFHGGALAIGLRPKHEPGLDELIASIPTEGPMVLIGLAGLTTMDNIGGIFRIAAALGANGILLDDACTDPLLRRCIRISMGQVFRMPWARVSSLPDAISELKPLASVDSVAIENLADATPLVETVFPARSLLVIGNEGHGIDPATLAACSLRVRIEGPRDLPKDEGPGGPDERSLNAATATAIALHAAMHRRCTGDVEWVDPGSGVG